VVMLHARKIAPTPVRRHACQAAPPAVGRRAPEADHCRGMFCPSVAFTLQLRERDRGGLRQALAEREAGAAFGKPSPSARRHQPTSCQRPNLNPTS
jgi:hypothetical protein